MNGSLREPPLWLPAVAEALAEALPRLHGLEPDPLISEILTALTAALERGELELPLAGPPPEGVEDPAWPEGHRLALATSPLCRDPEGPLALEEGCLLWRRWQRRRRAVLENLLARISLVEPEPGLTAPSSPEPEPEPAQEARQLDPHQHAAVAAVLRHGLVLLEGGPGTGKTSTVAAMLQALRHRHPQARIHLAAPTGKAAARLRAATGDTAPCTTLHRLLESRGERFGRHRHHPLALDLLVVDEVSMVDLALMEALLDALPNSCRLVLVGDPAQLPPVAPGPLLLELQRPWVRQRLAGAAITLRTPYRSQGAIATATAELRAAIELPQGEVRNPLAAIRTCLGELGEESNLRWMQASPSRPPGPVLRRLQAHAEDLAVRAKGLTPSDEAAGQELLRTRDRLMVLAPLRRGPWGLERLHRALLGERSEGPARDWPPGTPVLCRRNLPDLGLANGDVGVLVGGEGEGRDPAILFGEIAGAGPIWVHPAQLAGALEPAFVLTVHKAQGSEADEVVVLLPSPAQCDQRLLYTALTRARRQALLVTPPFPGEAADPADGDVGDSSPAG